MKKTNERPGEKIQPKENHTQEDNEKEKTNNNNEE
jgi:hypothetical protein